MVPKRKGHIVIRDAIDGALLAAHKFLHQSAVEGEFSQVAYSLCAWVVDKDFRQHLWFEAVIKITTVAWERHACCKNNCCVFVSCFIISDQHRTSSSSSDSPLRCCSDECGEVQEDSQQYHGLFHVFSHTTTFLMAFIKVSFL